MRKTIIRLSILLSFTALILRAQAWGQGPSAPGLTTKAIHVETQTSKADEQIVVTDFTGKQLVLDRAAQRIVALAPHIVENLFTIGAGHKVVGVVSHSDHPKEALSLPIVGGYEKTDYERIIELKPDLIIAWESGNSHSNIAKLRELGFKVLIDQPDSLDDIAKSLRMLGAATGTDATANRVANEFLATVKRTRANNADKRRISTFYQVWNEPLISINGDHIISDAIRACGGRNIFANSVAVAPRTNIESVIAQDPEAIIASGMGEARPEWLDDWQQWNTLKAVKQNNLFFVNPDHLQRHTVRQLLAINTICTQLDQARTRGLPR